MAKNNPYMISQRFLEQNELMIIHDSIYLYNGKYFVKKTKHELERSIYSFLTNEEKACLSAIGDTRKIAEHLLLNESLMVDDYPSNERYICCNNGVVDIQEMKLLPHSPEYKCMFCINANYTKNPKKGLVFNSFLQDLFYIPYEPPCAESISSINQLDEVALYKKTYSDIDNEAVSVLQEYLGYFISDCSKAKKMAIINGKPNTGKSVLLALIEHIVGKRNVSNVNMTHINNEFYLSHLCDNRLNICYDTKDMKLKDISVFKQLTSPTDYITVRSPHGAPYSTSRKAKLMFACNTLPELLLNHKERDSYFARIIVFSFDNEIDEDDRNPNLLNELIEEKDYIFKWLLNGYKRFLDNDYAFSESERLQEIMEQYESRYNIASSFVDNKITYKRKSKVFSKTLEKALKQYIDRLGIPYEPQYKTELFDILKNNSAVHKKVKIDGKSGQGFYGIKLKN